MLKSGEVALIALTENHLPDLFEWINEREQVLLNAAYRPVNEEAHRAWFSSLHARKDVVIFGIKIQKTDMLIGTCQLQNINYIHRNAEMRIRIGKQSEREQGYGTEAIRLILDFAFKDLNLHRVYLYVFKTNVIALHVYKKVGFVQEGLLRKGAHINGEYVDVVVMGILREEYYDC
jgi:diamine N-acetyltransferase